MIINWTSPISSAQDLTHLGVWVWTTAGVQGIVDERLRVGHAEPSRDGIGGVTVARDNVGGVTVERS